MFFAPPTAASGFAKPRNCPALILALVTACALAGASGAFAANRYVREGATGSNNGTDWNNAYQVLPNTLVRGDTYYVADGTYPLYTFRTPHQGTTPVTIKKAIETDHGTDTGWNSSFGDNQAVFGRLNIRNGYLIIDGQSRNEFDWRIGYGIKFFNVNANDKIIDCSGVTDLTLRFVEVQGVGVDHSVNDRGMYTYGSTNFLITHCYFHDFGGVPFLTGGTNGHTLEYSLIARNSSEPSAHSEAIADENSDNLTIRYNRFEDIEGTGFIVVLSRGARGLVSNNWQIYGNIFYYTVANPTNRTGVGDGAIAVINSQIATNWKIYNNTFANIPPFSARIAMEESDVTQTTNIEVRNNLWYNCENAGHTGPVTASHNYYINTPSKAGEANKQTGTADPFFNINVNDFRIDSATDAGFSLAFPYNIDMLNIVRGADVSWDRGAFEFSLGVPVTPTPTPPPTPVPTPDAGTVSAPVLDPPQGIYSNGVSVTLTTATPNAVITYTTDGSTPTTASPAYTAPLLFTQTTTIRARAFFSGMTPSAVSSGLYTISDGPPGQIIPGLVAAYSLGEGAGGVAFDSSGLENHGAINGPGFITGGRFGRCLFFDGEDDLVITPDDDTLDLSAGMTLMAWVRPSSNLYGWQYLVGKGAAEGISYYIAASSIDGYPYTGLWIDDKPSTGGGTIPAHWEYTGMGTQLQAGNWYHLASTFEEVSPDIYWLRIYLNGVQQGSGVIVFFEIDPTALPLYLGGNPYFAEYYAGHLDEVRVYNRALTSSEILFDMITAIEVQDAANSAGAWEQYE